MSSRKCKMCQVVFEKDRPLQFVCSPLCAIKYNQKQKEKSNNRDRKEMKARLMTRTEHLNLLQVVFNTYIRKRDFDKGCITCGTPIRHLIKYDAGHYFSVGAYPNLRFNENNCFGQCVACNQHRHGSIAEYIVELPKRIGKKKVEELYADRDKPLKLSIEEIKELIITYKNKIKKLTT